MAADLALLLRVQEENTQALKSMQASLQSMEQAGNATGVSFTKLAGSIAVGEVAARAALGAIGALTNTFVGAVRGAVDLSSSLEQTRIGLTAMLGSGAKANAMLADLQDFAENTNFNFPGLADGAKRMMAMGFAAQDVIPIMGDVANAVGAVGGGKEVLDRVILALGQMQAKGMVSSEEMRQLAEAGIPAWTMLSQAIGKTVAETMKMVENREIASGTFFQAFHNFSQEKWGDIQAQQARTFSGAMSNVQDVLGRLSVAGFASLFDALTNGANLLYQFLKTDQVKQWAADFNASVGVVLQALAPLGDALKQILGIGSGGSAATVAAQAAAPAAAITATVQAGAESSKAAIAALDAQAREVNQTIHGINQEMTALNEQSAALKFQIEDVKSGFEDQLRPLKDVHDELQRAAQDAKVGFDNFLNPLKDALDETKRKITDIKDGYNDQIAAVKTQIDAIQGANDELRKQQDIQNAIYDAQLRAEALAAQGDPVAKAELQNKLDDIGFDRNHIANQIQLLQLKNKHGDNDKKIAALKKEQNELDAKAIDVREKIAGLVDRVALAEVKKKEAIQAQEKAQTAIVRAQENLEKQKQIDPLKQQVQDLQAARDAAVAPLEATAKGLQNLYDSVKNQQEEALAAIEAKQRENERAIQDTEAAQRKILEPLEEQAKTLERQKSALQLSAQHWAGIKQNISDAKAELEAAAKAAKESGLVPGGGGLNIGGGGKKSTEPEPGAYLPIVTVTPLISKETVENIRAAATATGELAKQMSELSKSLLPVVQLFATIAAGLIIVEGFTKFGLAIAAIIAWGGQFVAGMGMVGQALAAVGAALAAVGIGTAAVVAAIAAFVVGLGLYITNFGGFRDATNEIFKNIWDTTVQVFQKMGENISGAIALMLKDSREGGSNFWPAMKDGLDDFTTKFGGWLKTQTDNLGKWKDGVIAWLEDIGTSGGELFGAFWMLGQNILGAIKDGIAGSFDWFLGQIKEHFTKDLPDYVKELLKIQSPSGVFRDIGHNIVAGLQHGLEKKFPDVQSVMARLMGGLGGGGTIGGNALDWIKTAMSITGVGQDWMKGLQQLLFRENTPGDPHARNPEPVIYKGVNYGHASGLFQMLPSTFSAHALAKMKDIWNPIDNAVSAIRYIQSHPRYGGSPYGIPGLFGGGYAGYEKGGIVPNTGLAMLHQNEMVLTPARQRQLLSGQVGGGVTVVVNVGGSVTTEQDLVTTIQRGLIQLQRRNGGRGLVLI